MKDNHQPVIAILLGSVTATAVGSIFLQALAALVLGVIGALGGYLFNRYMKEHLDKFIVIRTNKTKIVETPEKDTPKAE